MGGAGEERPGERACARLTIVRSFTSRQMSLARRHLRPADGAVVKLLARLIGADGARLLHVRLATVKRTLRRTFDRHSVVEAASWTRGDALADASGEHRTARVHTRVARWVALNGAPSTAGRGAFAWPAVGMNAGNGLDWDVATAADRHAEEHPPWHRAERVTVRLTDCATVVVVWPRCRGLRLAPAHGITELVEYVERRHGISSGDGGGGGGGDAVAADAAVMPALAAADDPERAAWLPHLAASLASASSSRREERTVIRMVRLATALGGVDLTCAAVQRLASDAPKYSFCTRRATAGAPGLAAVLAAVGAFGWEALAASLHALIRDATSYDTTLVAGLLAVLAPCPDILAVATAAAAGSWLNG